MAGPVVNIGGGPFASGSTPVYQAQIVDATGNGLSYAVLTTLTLTIVDTRSGAVVNNCLQVNILNTDRGQIDNQGNLTITLQTGDTSMAEVPGLPRVQRSLVIDWTYNSGASAGRHQVNFVLEALAGL